MSTLFARRLETLRSELDTDYMRRAPATPLYCIDGPPGFGGRPTYCEPTRRGTWAHRESPNGRARVLVFHGGLMMIAQRLWGFAAQAGALLADAPAAARAALSARTLAEPDPAERWLAALFELAPRAGVVLETLQCGDPPDVRRVRFADGRAAFLAALDVLADAPAVQAGVDADQPDAHGYVATPTDPSAYVSAAKILAEHTPLEWRLTAVKLGRLLDDYADTRVRWTRPAAQRRSVHLADWTRCVERRKAGAGDSWPAQAAGELASRTAAVRRGRA